MDAMRSAGWVEDSARTFPAWNGENLVTVHLMSYRPGR
jgi:hypothetical protein